MSLLLLTLACTRGDVPSPGEGEDALWDLDGLPVFRVYTGEDWEGELRGLVEGLEDCDRKPYASADVVFENPETGGEELYEDVGWRFRGQSAIDNIDLAGERIGFKLSFNEFVDGRRFHDLRKINLLGTEGDYSLMREHTALWIMREAGVPAPRVNYALLYINDAFQGIFPHSEEADDEPYLEHHFGDDQGSLYKAEGYCGWKADFDWEGDDPDYYVETYEPRADTEAADMEGDLIPMIACVNEVDDADFAACIGDWVDAEEWRSEIAVDALMPDVDGMMGAGQNFMLYRDPATALFVVYPWDKDLAMNTYSLVEGWTIADFHPTWMVDFESILGRRLIELDPGAYCERVQQVAALATPDRVVAELSAVGERLQPFIEADPFMDRERWVWAAEEVAETYRAHLAEALAQAEGCEL